MRPIGLLEALRFRAGTKLQKFLNGERVKLRWRRLGWAMLRLFYFADATPPFIQSQSVKVGSHGGLVRDACTELEARYDKAFLSSQRDARSWPFRHRRRFRANRRIASSRSVARQGHRFAARDRNLSDFDGNGITDVAYSKVTDRMLPATNTLPVSCAFRTPTDVWTRDSSRSAKCDGLNLPSVE